MSICGLYFYALWVTSWLSVNKSTAGNKFDGACYSISLSLSLGLSLYCSILNNPPSPRPNTSGKYICSAWVGITLNSPGNEARI